MTALPVLLAGASLAAPVAAGIIKPALEALTWKFNDTNFWAPVHLDSTVYHLQSPAGVVPDSLSRRELPSGGYLSCTIVTVEVDVELLSSDVIKAAMAGYEADDVWNAEHFLDCLFVQYRGSGTGVAVDASFGAFLDDHQVETAFLDDAFDLVGLATTAHILSVATECEARNGPHVVKLPGCEDAGISLTPVYALHPDNFDGTYTCPCCL
jgi:hypothetical protein